jgi:FMN phosphatase YigB (HAD superfamily)
LKALRPEWRIGPTNVLPEVRAGKVAALGLEGLVDCVVYAHEHGSGAGKPERAPFLEALRRLDVPASRTCSSETMITATSLALRASACTPCSRLRGTHGRPVRADTVVVSLRDVPQLAERLIDARWKRRQVA